MWSSVDIDRDLERAARAVVCGRPRMHGPQVLGQATHLRTQFPCSLCPITCREVCHIAKGLHWVLSCEPVLLFPLIRVQPGAGGR